MQSKYRQHLGKTVWLLGLLVAWWATHPFFFTPLPLVGVLVGTACNFLVCWLLGLLAVDTVLDGHAIFLFVWVDGWMAGWMDGWTLCK